MGQLCRHLGPGWLAYRAAYALQMRAGVLERRTSVSDWDAQPLAALVADPGLAEPAAYACYRRNSAPRFFFDADQCAAYRPLFARWDAAAHPDPVALADAVISGRLRYFEHAVVETGFPPDWHANPFTGERTPSDRHWSRIGDFGSGDIKVIWEPNRFGFAYALVRAYWRTGDERYAEAFWQAVEDWQRRNPPNVGANWKCGQEITFRVMAWCFGLYGFLHSPATTDTRVAALARLVAVSGRRIAANIGYALSQQNNHGISEAVGLFTIGTLFPELRGAAGWQARGRKLLEQQGRALIYEDGAFSQHSANYHRVMLHDYLWALRLGELVGAPFSDALQRRVGKAGHFLYQIQDGESGGVPCYGSNDGAFILPLSNSDYQDYRPVVQAVHYLTERKRCWMDGPWDEALLWLFGPEAVEAPVQAPAREDFAAPQGGCHTLRAERGFVFVRCGSFRHRPAQADLLHVDLWWRGLNIALDPGTYSYNTPAPWDNALGNTAYHNTVTVDGLDQMERIGRFLWLPWAHGNVHCRGRSETGHLEYWEGEHDGYRRLPDPVAHRRAVVRLGEEHWLVLDLLEGHLEHAYRLHWLFPDLPSEFDEVEGLLTLQTPAGAYQARVGSDHCGSCSLLRADPASPVGWRAPYYGAKEPALSLSLTVRGQRVLFWSLLGPDGCRVEVTPDQIRVAGRQVEALLRRTDSGASLLAEGVALQRPAVDQLVVTMNSAHQGSKQHA